MTSDTDNDFDLHGLVQRRPLDALDLIAEKVEELSKLVTALDERLAKLEFERHDSA
jgi:hypothetical protein